MPTPVSSICLVDSRQERSAAGRLLDRPYPGECWPKESGLAARKERYRVDRFVFFISGHCRFPAEEPSGERGVPIVSPVSTLTPSFNDVWSSMLRYRAGEAQLSKVRESESKRIRAEQDHEVVRDQLVRAFPLPKSGSFDDLLSAIDDQFRVRRT